MSIFPFSAFNCHIQGKHQIFMDNVFEDDGAILISHWNPASKNTKQHANQFNCTSLLSACVLVLIFLTKMSLFCNSNPKLSCKNKKMNSVQFLTEKRE